MKKQQAGFISSIISLVSLLMFFISCTNDPVSYDSLDPVCFDTQVLPILQTSCGMTGCHDGTEEGFIVTDYNSVMNIVKPGDPRGSTLYKVITDINSDEMMPPDQPLTKFQRNIIQVWIGQGAPETICAIDTGGNPVKEICFVQDILPMILSSCGTTGCHDAITHEEDRMYINYNTIMDDIDANNPGNSKIYEVVTQTGEDRMPPAPRSPLTSVQIAALSEWIDKGAPNSDCPQNVCDTAGVISFSAQVSPILQQNCVGCHNTTLASGNINLSNHSQIIATAMILRTGTPVLQGSINRLNGFVAMPLTFSLDQCNIDIIDKWIAQGAANN